MAENQLKRMKIHLPSELGKFVEEQVALGKYPVEIEVIIDALWMLRKSGMTKEEQQEDLRKEIEKGLDSGEAKPLDMERIKAEGRKRIAIQRRRSAIEDIRDGLLFLETLSQDNANTLLTEVIEALPAEQRKTIAKKLYHASDFIDAVEGIRDGLEDMKHGRARSAAEVFAEISEKLGLPSNAVRPTLIQWIGVKDLTPKEEGAFLVAGESMFVAMADWCLDQGGFWSVGREAGFSAEQITHWASPPASPTQFVAPSTLHDIFADVRADMEARGITDEELEKDIAQALAEVRATRRTKQA